MSATASNSPSKQRLAIAPWDVGGWSVPLKPMSKTIELKTWRVDGLRNLGNGGTITTLSTAFGKTADDAWRWWDKLMNHGTGTGTVGQNLRWQRHELTFTEEVAK